VWVGDVQLVPRTSKQWSITDRAAESVVGQGL
jgi:hypothetical protein